MYRICTYTPSDSGLNGTTGTVAEMRKCAGFTAPYDSVRLSVVLPRATVNRRVVGSSPT